MICVNIGWMRDVSAVDMRKIVVWVCQNLSERKFNTKDASMKLGIWLSSKHNTTTRKVIAQYSGLDKTKLTWDWEELVDEEDGFDIMSHMFIDWSTV